MVNSQDVSFQLTLPLTIFEPLGQLLQQIGQAVGEAVVLTKQLVELHQGRIEVESTLGIGSTFTVWLPAIANYNV